VACSNSSNVISLDPADGSVVSSLPVEGDPGQMATDANGAVWVAIRGGHE
jgi:DNA-binding beta-propeller fold protein YncE